MFFQTVMVSTYGLNNKLPIYSDCYRYFYFFALIWEYILSRWKEPTIQRKT